MTRALGWLIGLFGVLCLIASGAIAFVMVYLAETDVPTWNYAVAGVGAFLIGLWLFLDWGSLSQAGKDQTVARSLTAGFATVLAGAVAIALNVVSHKYDDRWDFTETKRYTLSQQSVDIAKGLDREVEVVAFFPAGHPSETNFRDLIENYQRSTTLLKATYHDPYGDPLVTEEMKITNPNGTVIVKAGDNTQRLESDFDEEAFTNALVKVTSSEQHPVCFVTGHGEEEARDERTEAGLGVATLKLEGQNYKVSEITLAEGAPKPEICKVVVLASPRVDLLAFERDRLIQYVAAGGNLLVLLDPLMAPETAADMARLGLKVGNDAVIEGDPNRQLQGGDPTFVLLDESSWDIHPVTAKLEGLGFMRLARSVGKGDDIAGLNVQILAHASEQSWGETALSDPGGAQPDPGVDIVGNVPLAAVIEVTDPSAMVTESPATLASAPGLPTAAAVQTSAPLPKKAGGKAIVFGDSDFATNQMILNGINQDIFLNSVAWMVGEGDQISIRANEAGKGKLTLNLVTGLLAGVTALVIVPGLAIAAALGMYLRRRRM